MESISFAGRDDGKLTSVGLVVIDKIFLTQNVFYEDMLVLMLISLQCRRAALKCDHSETAFGPVMK